MWRGRGLRAAWLATSALIASPMLMAAGMSCALAADATWLGVTRDYGSTANWTTGTVPSGTATFGDPSANKNPLVGASTTIGAWIFNAPYVVDINPGVFLTFTGGGTSSAGNTGLSPIIGNSGTIEFKNSSRSDGTFLLNSNNIFFENSSTLGSGAVANFHLLGFGDTATAANGAIDNNSVSAVTEFLGSSSAGHAVIQNNSGQIVFGGNATAGNATITNNGTLSFFINSTGGNAFIANNGSLQFLGNGTAGDATIVNGVGSSIDFSSTIGPHGDNKVDIFSLTGAGQVFLGGNQLTLGRDGANATFGGSINDGGAALGAGASLVKAGAGTLTLTGNSTYTGATTVNGGVLELNGDFTSSSGVVVNSGGTLAGSGKVGPTTIASGGALTPGTGTPGSALTVQGNLAFQSGAQYMVRLAPANATNVAGTASLNGATVNAIFAPGKFVSRQYTILSAGDSLDGTFNSTVKSNFPGFVGSLSYDTNKVLLNVHLDFSTVTPTVPKLNFNQVNIGNALTNFFNTNGGIPGSFGALTPQGLTQAAGEPASTPKQTTLSATTLFMNLMTDPDHGNSGVGNGDFGGSGGNSGFGNNGGSNSGFYNSGNNNTGFNNGGSGGNSGLGNNGGSNSGFYNSGNNNTGFNNGGSGGNSGLGDNGGSNRGVGGSGGNGGVSTGNGGAGGAGGKGGNAGQNTSNSGNGGNGGKAGLITGNGGAGGKGSDAGPNTNNSGYGGNGGKAGLITGNGGAGGKGGDAGPNTNNSGYGGNGGKAGLITGNGGAGGKGGNNGNGGSGGNGGVPNANTGNAAGTGKNNTSKSDVAKTNPGKDGDAGKTNTSKGDVSKTNPGKDGTGKDNTSKDDVSKNKPVKDDTGKNNTSKGDVSKNKPVKDDTGKNNTSKDDVNKSDPGKGDTGKGKPGDGGVNKGKTGSGGVSSGSPDNGGVGDGNTGSGNSGSGNIGNGNSGTGNLGGRSEVDGGTSAASAFARDDSDPANASRDRRERDAYAAMSRKAPPRSFVPQDTFASRWSVWAMGYGGSQTTDGNAVAGSSATTSRIFGTAVGFDHRISRDTVAGFALGGGGSNFVVANGLGGGRSDLFQAGAFVRHNEGPAYVTAALAYGWQDVTTNRTLTIVGLDQLRAEFNANTWSGRIEGGYRFVAPVFAGVGVTPYVAGQASVFMLPAYAESAVAGASTFALSYAAKDTAATRSELGVRTDKSFRMANVILTLHGRAALAHDFNTNSSVTATFQSLPGASFVVNGAMPAADAALVTTAAEVRWRNGWSAAATFEGEFSNVTRSYAGKGMVQYAW